MQATFTEEVEQSGYGPRRIVDIDYRTKPRMRNNGYAVFTIDAFSKIEASGDVLTIEIPQADWDDHRIESARRYGWIAARFRDGSTTPLFVHRNSDSDRVFSIQG